MKRGDRVRHVGQTWLVGKIVETGHEWDALELNIVKTYTVEWDIRTTAHTGPFQARHLMHIKEPNEIMKDICSK